MDDWAGPSYQKAVMGDPNSRVHVRGPWDDEGYPTRTDASKSVLAQAWPTMSLREKAIGVTVSIAVGVIGTSIIIALIS